MRTRPNSLRYNSSSIVKNVFPDVEINASKPIKIAKIHHFHIKKDDLTTFNDLNFKLVGIWKIITLQNENGLKFSEKSGTKSKF